MNCEQTRNNYIYSQIESLSDIEKSTYESHISSCAECRSLFAVEQKLSATLEHLPVDIAPKRILQRTMQAITHQQEMSKQRTINTGLGFALAATLMLAIFVPDIFGPKIDSKHDVLSTISMSMHTQQMVNIQFDSPEQVAEAVIVISLPENLRVAGYTERKELRWTTSLKAGKNTLKLPLIASTTGSSMLRSELMVDGKSKTFNLQVDVMDEQSPTSAIGYTSA